MGGPQVNEPVSEVVSERWPELPIGARVLVFPTYVDDAKTDAEATEDARLETLERRLSAPPPYLYGGRKRQCFFKPRKMRWRKG